ncbi:MAG: hypothetical protein RLY71_4256, partial [Pseudomonadota bacterium]
MSHSLATLETPALLLDEPRLRANIVRLRSRIDRFGVLLRPHVKTAKCLEVQRLVDGSGAGAPPGPITVSTLREADQFAAAGYTDITYAVGLAPNKFAH